MIEAATILPTKMLQFARKDQYHMSLAQLIGVDAAYTEWYQNQVNSNKFVIMDNGAAEGEAPIAEELLIKYEILHPSEMVLPDTIFDMDDTIEKGLRALQVLDRKVDCTFMAVPQGQTFEEWVDCARVMLFWPIETIGVSKFCTPQYGPMARYRCVEALYKAMEETGIQVNIHLLGCWEDPREIGQIQTKFNVRGCDSIIAYAFAQAGRLLDMTTNERPNYHPKFSTDSIESDWNQDLLQANITRWRAYCHGELR